MSTRTCLRCGHSWYPRYAIRNKQCPRCKSPYWDTPRKSTQLAQEIRQERDPAQPVKAATTCTNMRCQRVGRCICNAFKEQESQKQGG